VAGSLTLFSPPGHGTATADISTGTVDYTPTAGYFGADSFQYTVSSAAGLSSNIATVTIDVQLINDAPIANDDLANAPLSSVTVNVIANDTDLDGIAPAPGGLDPTSVAIVDQSLDATVENNFDGTVIFTKGGCELTASCFFTHTVSDINTPALTSNVATVTITSASNQAPVAKDDAASVPVDQSVTINVAANDTDDIGLDLASIVVTTPTLDGSSALANGDGTITFIAVPNSGVVTFGYTIDDSFVPAATSNEATVTVTVNPNPDILAVQRAQCKAGKNEWRVDGTSSILTPHSVTVYEGQTVGGGRIIATTAVDNLGTWRLSKNNTSAACASIAGPHFLPGTSSNSNSVFVKGVSQNHSIFLNYSYWYASNVRFRCQLPAVLRPCESARLLGSATGKTGQDLPFPDTENPLRWGSWSATVCQLLPIDARWYPGETAACRPPRKR